MKFLKTNATDSEKEGFTLVELLVAVVLLVALTTIAIPVFLGQINRVKDDAARTNIENTHHLIANTRGISGQARYEKTSHRVSITMTADLDPPFIENAGQITLPPTGIVYSNDAELDSQTEQTINLENFCVQDTGVHTYHMNENETETTPGPCI